MCGRPIRGARTCPAAGGLVRVPTQSSEVEERIFFSKWRAELSLGTVIERRDSSYANCCERAAPGKRAKQCRISDDDAGKARCTSNCSGRRITYVLCQQSTDPRTNGVTEPLGATTERAQSPGLVQDGRGSQQEAVEKHREYPERENAGYEPYQCRGVTNKKARQSAPRESTEQGDASVQSLTEDGRETRSEHAHKDTAGQDQPNVRGSQLDVPAN